MIPCLVFKKTDTGNIDRSLLSIEWRNLTSVNFKGETF